MPKSMHQNLSEKGWSSEEIDYTLSRLYDVDKSIKHEKFEQQANPIIYWAFLIVAIIGNFVIAFVFIPFMLILNQGQVLIILATLGLIFGAMFNLLIKDIEKIDYRHHIVAGVFIPAISAITIFVMVGIANNLGHRIQLEIIKNPFIITVTYFLAFSLPYMVYKFRDYKRERKFKNDEAANVSDSSGISNASGVSGVSNSGE